MQYAAALSRAWSDLERLGKEKNYSLRFLNDDYSIDLQNQRVFCSSSNAEARTHVSILILHYLIQKLRGLTATKGQWISFKELPGGQGYYPTFKKRVIDVILKKYRDKPQDFAKLTERFKAKKAELADISIILEAFKGLAILITFWRGDEEFAPEANVLFDKSIESILCTEDIVVLAEIVAHRI